MGMKKWKPLKRLAIETKGGVPLCLASRTRGCRVWPAWRPARGSPRQDVASNRPVRKPSVARLIVADAVRGDQARRAKASGCLLFVGFLGQARKSTRAPATRSRQNHPLVKARETRHLPIRPRSPWHTLPARVDRFARLIACGQPIRTLSTGARAPFLACPRKGAKRRAPCVLVLRTREPHKEAPGLASVERLFGSGSTRHPVATNLEATSLSLRPGRPTLARQDTKGKHPSDSSR